MSLRPTAFLVAASAFGLMLSCASGCADPPVLEAPGAKAVAVTRTADAIALVESLDRAGFGSLGSEAVDAKLLRAIGPALVADAPVVASLLDNGVIIVATHVDGQAGAALLGAGARPVLGKTSAIVLDGKTVLVRADRKRVLAALGVESGQEATVAAVLELMATQKDAKAPMMPAPGDTQVRIAAGVLPVDVGVVDGTVRLDGQTVVVNAVAPQPPAEVAEALATPSPPWACGLEKGAGLVVHVPRFPGIADDAFQGRMFVAAYPLGDSVGIVLAGVPASGKTFDEDLDAIAKVPGARVMTESGRTLVQIDGERRLRFLSGPDMLVVALDQGEPGVPLENLGAQADCRPSALLRADADALARILLPVVVTKEVLLRALVTGDLGATEPLAALRGISRVEADAWRDGSAIRVSAHVGLRAVPQ